ncbi:MAG: hypothetical protein K2Q32_07335 [Alphaproteobacteria bacterium]|nr:hypothetical protein [Alphaproteobacteria bacterium]
MAISPETRLFMETRAICQMAETGREAFLEPSPALIKIIADKLTPYADAIAGYGKPPAMEAAWDKISEDTGMRHGHINIAMLDIATIHRDAAAYLTNPSKILIDNIQSARTMLRTQSISPSLRLLGEAAAVAVTQPNFIKGGFVPSI